MIRSYLLLVVPLWLMPCVIAQGPAGGSPPRRVFLEALDTDGDGQISAAEIAAASRSLLKLDRNGDGQITAAEYNPRMDDRAATSELERRLMALDKNGDGVLSAEEMPERMKPMFDRGDTNHDGKLDKAEIRAMNARQADPQGRPVGRGNFQSMDPIVMALDADRDGVISAVEIATAAAALKTLDVDGSGSLEANEIRMKQQTPKERAQHLFDEWDTNKDGSLSKQEMPDRMQGQFESIDLNHDGKVDLEEATRFMEAQPGGRPGGAPAGASTAPRP